MAVHKRVATYGMALTGAATTLRYPADALAIVELAEARLLPRRWLGTGTLAVARVDSLTELVPLVDRRDQTVTAFGFDRAQLLAFLDALRGRGVDRVVPFGEALRFDAVWDGYDLVQEFSRTVSVLT